MATATVARRDLKIREQTFVWEGVDRNNKPLRGEIGQLLHQRPLIPARQGRFNGVAVEEIGKVHYLLTCAGATRRTMVARMGDGTQSVCGSTQPMFPSSRR